MELEKNRMPTAKEQRERTYQEIEGPIFEKFLEVALQKIDKAVEGGNTKAIIEFEDFGYLGPMERLPKKYKEEFEKYGYHVSIYETRLIVIQWY